MCVKPRRGNLKSCLFFGLLLLLLGGLGIRQIYLRGNEPPYGGARWRHDQENSVLEAVFRYQIRENRNANQVCFLSVRDTAPDRALMQHFQDLPFVLPLSRRFGYLAGDYQDRTTGHAELHFWADKIAWDSDLEVHIEGGGAAAVRSGDAGRFTVLWQRGIWKVTYDPSVRF